MKKLSVVLATFNEEENIAKCLDSIKDIADEIIIVDGTSTDRTVEIAKKYKAKVFVKDNPAIFHINKQIAIDKATKDFILQLDADEVVSKELGEEIADILKKDNLDEDGFWIPRKNFFLGRFLMKGGQYPDYTVRFYKKGKGRLPQKDVHEQAIIEGKIGHLKSPLLHYPYKDFKAYKLKWMRYNKLLAKQISEELENANLFMLIFYFATYFIARPGHWMLTTYVRHKGFMDLWQGFVFSLMSALRFPVSFVIYLNKYHGKK